MKLFDGLRHDTPRIMYQVLFALLPGTAALCYVFGIGIVFNILVASATALLTEALVLRARRRSLTSLKDGSALVTGILLALALPPLLPVWIIIAGSAFGMLFGKHLYGGLGHNPFNPAMVGYAALIVSFPLAMSYWPLPGADLPWIDVVNAKCFGLGSINMSSINIDSIDIYSGATALDSFKFRGALTIDEVWQTSSGFGVFAGVSWEWINGGFAVGGIYLIATRVIPPMAPLGMLAALAICATLFYDSGSSQSLGSPLFQLFSGATMLGAFFIITDPVSSPDTARGLWLFGIGVGVITFIIRSVGAYPDGVAFAVLLMNALVPLLDHRRGVTS
ncbi:MAG: electron transport complex protein RnfD [Candidatus Azotimanducaceae bacterium]|jgi:electron transport complex protein RnfD